MQQVEDCTTITVPFYHNLNVMLYVSICSIIITALIRVQMYNGTRDTDSQVDVFGPK